jgi:hypothetical protein
MFRRNLVCFGGALKRDHDLAKVGVEGSGPFARSKSPPLFKRLFRKEPPALPGGFFALGSTWGPQKYM